LVANIFSAFFKNSKILKNTFLKTGTMKLIKISKNHQITIPKMYHDLCKNGWFALTVADNEITLNPIQPITEKSQKEILKELLQEYNSRAK